MMWSNSYLLELLDSLLEIVDWHYLNFSHLGHIINANESKSHYTNMDVDCPYGAGYFVFEYLVNVDVIPAIDRNYFDGPSDPPEVDCVFELLEVRFYDDSDGNEYKIDWSHYSKKQLLVETVCSKICIF